MIFVVVLLVACLGQVASDIYAPSVPAIAHHFATAISHVQLSMALYLFGITLSLFFYGPISDALGRRPPLIVGLIIMLIGTLVCLFSTSITLLLLGRFIQGVGVGAGMGLWRSIFRDTYSGNQLAKYSSYLTIAVMVIVPSAPALGGYLQQYIGWQANFIFLACYTILALWIVIFRYKETSQYHQKNRLSKEFITHSFKELFTSRAFMSNALCVFLTYGAFFCWFSIGPVLLIHVAGLSPVAFGWINLVGGGIAMGLGGLTNAKMVDRFGSQFMLQLGWMIMFIAGTLLLILNFIFGINVIGIVLPVILFYFGTTLIWPNAFSKAMSPFGHIAGYAGTTYSALQVGGGAVIGVIAAHVPHTNQVPLALIFMGAPVLAWIIYKKLEEAPKPIGPQT